MVRDKPITARSTEPQAVTSASRALIRFREWAALEEARPKSKSKVDPEQQALAQMDLLTRKIDKNPRSRNRDRNMARQNRLLALLVVRLARTNRLGKLR